MKIGNIVLVIGLIIGGYFAVIRGMPWIGAGISGVVIVIGWILSAIMPEEETTDEDEENDFKIDKKEDNDTKKDSDTKYTLEDL